MDAKIIDSLRFTSRTGNSVIILIDNGHWLKSYIGGDRFGVDSTKITCEIDVYKNGSRFPNNAAAALFGRQVKDFAD